MPLPVIDLQAMALASRREVERKLTRYLCDTLGWALPRVSTTPAHVADFVNGAASIADRADCREGHAFSVHILISFLAGVGWADDPACSTLRAAFHATGLAFDTRLDLTLQRAIQLRQQHEQAQPLMHGISATLLLARSDSLTEESLWSALLRMMTHRGLEPGSAKALYLRYEADGCRRHKLPVPPHQVLDGAQEQAYRYYAKRLPQPSDDLLNLAALPRMLLLEHILLAITFGRFFYVNPLLGALHACATQDPSLSERPYVLQAFLDAHTRALTGSSHGQ